MEAFVSFREGSGKGDGRAGSTVRGVLLERTVGFAYDELFALDRPGDCTPIPYSEPLLSTETRKPCNTHQLQISPQS